VDRAGFVEAGEDLLDDLGWQPGVEQPTDLDDAIDQVLGVLGSRSPPGRG
jgi:hypothetical protein